MTTGCATPAFRCEGGPSPGGLPAAYRRGPAHPSIPLVIRQSARYHEPVTTFWIQGLLLGLGAAVPIGPVNLEIMRRGLRGGFLPAFLTGLGAATIDTLYCIAAMLGFGALTALGGVGPVLPFVGAAVIFVLGAMTLRDALRPLPVQPPAVGGTAIGVRSYATGLLMTATNPVTLAFWLSVGAAANRVSVASMAERMAFVGGVAVGAIGWVIGFSLALHFIRHRISDRSRRLLTAAGGFMLVGFAVWMLAKAWLETGA